MSPQCVILDWMPSTVSVPFADVGMALLLLIPLQNNMSTFSVFAPFTQISEAESLRNVPPLNRQRNDASSVTLKECDCICEKK